MVQFEKLVWKTDWNTGIDSIDQQHQKLLMAINALRRQFDPSTDRPQAERLFDALEAYARIHFEHEEKLLYQTKYADLANHRTQHQDFFSEIKIHREQAKADSELNDAIADMLAYLLDWLISHILEVDMKYSPHLLKAGVK